MLRKIYLLVLICLLQAGTLLAQGRATGVVTDSQNQPLPGVSVSVKGKPQIWVAASSDGSFSLQVNNGDILSFRMVGFVTKEVTFTGQSMIAVQLQEESTNLQEVVVVGYGTANRRNVINSIQTVDSKQIENRPVVSFDQALAGKVAGVNISQSNGAPGGGISVSIRGTGSITGGTDPLYVIDGVPLSTASGDRYNQGNNASNYTVNPLNSINPADIENIQVLKDAASTAIYGSRGSNGVVIITTKKGSYGKKPVMAVNAYGGVASNAAKVDVMNAYDHANYTKLARDLSWVNRNPSKNLATDPLSARTLPDDRYPAYMVPYINGVEALTDTDWQDEFYQTAKTQNYDISVNGGTDRTRYFVSGNFLDQEGTIPNSGLKRGGMRFNMDSKLNEKLRIGIVVSPTFMSNKLVKSERAWGDEGLVIGTLMSHPQLPVYNDDGSYALDRHFQVNWSGESNVVQFQNPLALTNLIDNKMNQFRLTTSNNIEYDILKKLTFKTTLGADINYNVRNYYRPKSLSHRLEPAPTTTQNLGSVFNSNFYNLLWDNTLNYTDNINDKHDINIVVGNSVQKEINRNTNLDGRVFATDNVRTINTSQTQVGTENQREWSMMSYFSRASYSYQGKYLASATIRADGSSKFGAASKWGYFPSVSAGWRVSDENFFPKNVINELKLRTSYGVTGNNDIPYYGSMALLSTGGKYVIGDAVQAGLFPDTAPNENLSWETTRTFDAGLDMTFAKYFTLTADIYRSNTTDLLLDVPVPSASGYNSSLQNIGELENKGIELMLGMNRDFGQSNFTANVNFSANKNKVLALGPGQQQIISNGGLVGSHITRVGHPVGSFFGYNVLGKFETEEQVTNLAKFGNQKIGDFIYQDLNGDKVVNADDRVILGDNNADFQLGLNLGYRYKNFDFSTSAYTKQGVEVINTMHRYLAEAWGNNLQVYLSPEAPRPVWGVGSATHTRASSWQIEDASFIRIREIMFGYSLPQSISNRMKISRLRLYASFLNPFTWTNYSGYNPEVSTFFGSALTPGEEFGNYPVSKTSTIGLNVTF